MCTQPHGPGAGGMGTPPHALSPSGVLAEISATGAQTSASPQGALGTEAHWPRP